MCDGARSRFVPSVEKVAARGLILGPLVETLDRAITCPGVDSVLREREGIACERRDNILQVDVRTRHRSPSVGWCNPYWPVCRGEKCLALLPLEQTLNKTSPRDPNDRIVPITKLRPRR